MLLCKWCYNCKFPTAVYHVVLLTAMYLLCEVIIIPVVSFFFKENYAATFSLKICLFSATGAGILFFAFCKFAQRIILKEKDRYFYGVWLFVLPFASLFAVLIIFYFSVYIESSTLTNVLLISTSALIFAANAVVFYIYEKSLKIEAAYYKLQLEEQKNKLDYDYYKMLENRNETLSIISHDITNHLYSMQLCTNSDDLFDIVRYLAMINSQIDGMLPLELTRNKIVDVVISQKYYECEKLGISISFSHNNINFAFVNDADLCSVLSNMLNNAFEAAKNSEKKYISLEFVYRHSGNCYVIIVKNSCDKKPVLKNGMLVTSKKDKKNHGFGVLSINRIVKKYHGSYQTEYNEEEHEFASYAFFYE